MVTQEHIQDLVLLWQHRLNLGDWDIALVFSENVSVNGHECHMKVHRSSLYKRASLAMGASVLDHNKLPDCIEKDLIEKGTIKHDEYVESSIVHELMHLLIRDITVVSEMIEFELSTSVRNIMNEAQTRAEEETVEHIAQALVRNWPKEQ